MEELIGQSLDRYRIVKLLGEGGMGAVFQARDSLLQRDVAVKVMHRHFARQPNFQERFLQEAQVAARLDHPGIVKVFDFGQARSYLYIVMEFITGDNLRKMLQDLKATDKWIVLSEAIQLVRQVCLTVDYAHRQEVLHRDIKPDNIMLKAEPTDGLPYRPVMTDLGLAKLLEGGLTTQEGVSMGTPAYMSPEQALGEKTDARSDVYSLGILLYELVVSQLPFPIKTITQAIRYHTKEPPPPPRSLRPDLPLQIERIILRALEKDPADRFADAAGMAEVLADAIPAASQTTTAPTGTSQAVSLITEEQIEIEPRGPSIFELFPYVPADLRQDRISILSPDGTVRSVPIKAEELTIGRGPDNDVVLDDPKVSRRHARVEFDGLNYQVTDLHSTNGTYMAHYKLLPGVPEAWEPDKPLGIGDNWLRLERAQPPSEAPSAPTEGTRVDLRTEGMGRVGALMEVSEFSVEPGSSTTASVLVLNQGPVVDHFETSVRGIPAEWMPAPPPPIQLFPGTQQEVTLTIQPPRSPESRAGDYPLTVRVASQDAPDEIAEVEGTLTVAAYHQFASSLRPKRIRAGEAAQVAVENRGNTQQTFNLKWEDRANELKFEPDMMPLTVAEGQQAVAEFQGTPRQRRWIGGDKVHAFSTQVISPQEVIQTHEGEVVSKGLIPAWVPPLVVVLLIGLLLLLRSLIVNPPVIQSVTLDPPNPLVNEPVTVIWAIDNAGSVELRPLVSGLDAKVGRYTFEEGLPGRVSLTVVASNRWGSDEQAITIDVAQPEPEPPVLEEWSVFPTEVTQGQPVTIKWRVSNAESVTLQPFGTVDLTGEREDTPQQTKTYTLIATNQGKTLQKSQEVVVTIPPPDAPKIKVLAVEPESLVSGELETVRLTWDVERADTVTIEPEIGVVGLAGSRDVPAPALTTDYTLVAKNVGGEVRAQVRVEVIDAVCTVLAGGLNLREGPGTAYRPPIRALSGGTELTPLAFSPTGYPEGLQWIEVQVRGSIDSGWVAAGEQYVDCNIDVTRLPAGVPPPTPTTPPTPTAPPTAAPQPAQPSGGDGGQPQPKPPTDTPPPPEPPTPTPAPPPTVYP